MLVSGNVVVDRDGIVIDRLAPGQVFGEIAPLEQLPRTATVSASTPSELLRLDGAELVDAIGGHPSAHAATVSLRDERLARVRAASAGDDLPP